MTLKKSKISIIQYANRKQIKPGRLRWDLDSILPVLHNCEHYDDSFSFNYISSEFPSIDAAYKREDSVEVYLSVENDGVYGKRKSDGDCDLFLSLRDDVFVAAGETLVLNILRDLYSMFDEAKLLFHKRTWWAYTDNIIMDGGVFHEPSENEESALQDVAAWRYLDKLYVKNYSNWIKLNCANLILPGNSL